MKCKTCRYLLAVIITITLSLNSWSQTDSIKLIDFMPSSCNSQYIVEAIRKRISHIDNKSDTTVIKVAIIENCAYDMEDVIGKASLKNDTLQLDFLRFEELKKMESNEPYFVGWAACDCCFEFEYRITGFNKGILPPIKLKGDYIQYHPSKFIDRFYDISVDSVAHSDTLNYIDHLGYRQGKWVWKQDAKLKAELEYCNNEVTQGVWFDFFPNGETKEKYNWSKPDSLIFREYDIKGELIKKQYVLLHDSGFGEYEVIFTKEEIEAIKTKHNNAF